MQLPAAAFRPGNVVVRCSHAGSRGTGIWRSRFLAVERAQENIMKLRKIATTGAALAALLGPATLAGCAHQEEAPPPPPAAAPPPAETQSSTTNEQQQQTTQQSTMTNTTTPTTGSGGATSGGAGGSPQ
jgi:hypothetical protein